MNTRKYLFLLATLLGATGVLQAQKIPDDAAAAMAQAMAVMGKAAEKGAGSGSVDSKELRALLPDKDAFAGFKRIKAGVESNAMMGFKVVVAKAEFSALEGDAGFTVQYADIGGLNAIAKMAMTMQEVDEETETGFRRTAAYSGYKALEEYDEANKTGKVQIYTGDRVAVEIESHGVSFAVVKQVVAKVDLKKLAALKAAAPAAVEAK